MSDKRPLVAVVGPCASGKSTLVKVLREAGYHTRHVAQEHSYVQTMWQKITNPDVLIYLDVDYPATVQRRPHIDRGPQRVEIQKKRLAHAREHCDLYIDTNTLTPEQIQQQAISFLQEIAFT